MKAQLFARSVTRVQQIFEAASRELGTTIRYALIGGLAISTWGVARATQDIDFLADSEPGPLGDLELRRKLKEYVENQRLHAEWRVGAYDDPIPLILTIDLSSKLGELETQILWAHKRWQREALQRRIAVPVSRQRVYVLHPEDLILTKLDAGGPQDLLDVKELLSVAPKQLSIRRLTETASRLRLGSALKKCLREVRGKK